MIKHFYNEKKGWVIAIADGCQDDAIIRIVKRMQGTIQKDDKILQRLAKMQSRYSVIVQCHPGDTYDKEIGREIADERLKAKLNSAREKAVNRWKKHHLAMIQNV